MNKEEIYRQFEFRTIQPGETDQAIMIEQICFPPNEACTPDMMRKRIDAAPELFLTVVDKGTGRLAGFLNGISTREKNFRDAFFTDPSLHDNKGKNVMLCGLDVLPAYRGLGLARELVRVYSEKEKENGKERLVLTCLEAKVGMYQKFGFADRGIAESTWGGETWHEMDLCL